MLVKLPVPAPVTRVWSAVGYQGRSRRRGWEGERLHLEVRGLAADAGSDPVARRRLADEIETRLHTVAGVRWAVANPVLGRVVVSFEDDDGADGGASARVAHRREAIVAAVEEVEADNATIGRHFPPGLAEHPGDREPGWRALSALGADVGGLGLAAAGSLARNTPLPTELASLFGLVDAEPHLRGALANLFGPVSTDLGLAVVNATAQGLAHGPVGVLADLVWRAVSFSETAARNERWDAAEPILCGTPDGVTAPVVDTAPRPVPLPSGSVERYADRAGVASVGAAALATIATRDPRRAAKTLYAGIPKAARLGREVFSAHVTRLLSARGAVVLDSDAIRRLDRVDTVVLDAPTEGYAGRDGVPAPTNWMIDVVASARRAGHMVVVAGDRRISDALGADVAVDGGRGVLDAVRELQVDGCVVMLFASGDPAVADALWAADLAVGLWSAPGSPPLQIVAGSSRPRRAAKTSVDPVPWAADIIIDRPDAWLVVDSSGAAGQVARQSVALALLGAAASSAVVFGRPSSSAYGWAVNGAALVSMANATRAAVALARTEEPELLEAIPPWHSLDPDEVFRLVGSDRRGLSASEAFARIPPERRTPHPALRLVSAVGEELANPLTPILVGGAALSAALGGAVDATIVGGVTAVNALLGGLQRWRTEQAADALSLAGEVTVHVLRDGQMVPVPTHAVVVGDVLILRAGDVVPADARIVEADGVLADESSLTGESLPVDKSAEATGAETIAERRSMLYGDTSLAAGDAVAVVVATGEATEARSAMSGQRRITRGVEARLSDLTRRAIPISLGAGAAVVGAGLLHGRPLPASLASGVSLAVAAVPEGLPLVATMAQLSAAGRLARQGALVRNHRAIEALGRVDVLCTDKTGTLTVGRLAVRAVSDLSTDAGLAELGDSHRRVLAAALRATPEPEGGRLLAHPTDASIVAAAADAGIDERSDLARWTRHDELPFEPGQAFHATVGRIGARHVVSVKGAPEVMVERCSRIVVPGSTRTEPVSPAVWAMVDHEVDRLARRGLRVLAVAEGSIDAGAVADDDIDENAVTGLTLLGLVAIADPVRPEAASAVAGLRSAGVAVCMVTGDHPSTAEGIAAELGILNGHRVMHGGELASFDDAALDAVIGEVSVFARVTPADKVRIVQSFQRTGRVVAMTGDGANDAPAIRLADVGVAMGSRSTPAARQAADVIVTNDDIETIIAAIVEGRALWGSVREALAILLGGNLGEIGFTLAGAVLSGTAPINTRQLLLVNLLTDVAPALAIATRPPAKRRAEELLGEGPERSLGRPLERAIVERALLTAGGATAAWLPARLTGGPRRASTVALVALVGTQLAQTVTSGGRHPLVLAAGLGSAGVLVAIVQTPGLSQLFGCVPLDPLAWAQVGTAIGGATAVALARPLGAAAWRWLTTPRPVLGPASPAMALTAGACRPSTPAADAARTEARSA
ncbi:MAG: cation-translocating P-type ATPase [Acidimicrobiales bacterium]